MNENHKRKIIQEFLEDVVVDFIQIKSESTTLCYVNNTESVEIDGLVYAANSFEIATGDPAATESETSITLTDIDRTLTELLQSAKTLEVTIFTMMLSDVSSCIDGPYYYDVSSVSVSSETQQVSLSLGRKSTLSYNASVTTYNNRTFPGLY